MSRQASQTGGCSSPARHLNLSTWGKKPGNTTHAHLLLNQIHTWAITSPVPGGQRRELEVPDIAAREAEKLWDKQGFKVKDKDDSDMMVRLDLYSKKFTLLLAANSREQIVSLKSVQSAFKLLAYVIETYGVVIDRIGQSETSMHEQLVYNCIKNYENNRPHTKGNEKYPQSRDLKKLLDRHKLSAKEIFSHLQALIGMNMIQEIPPDRTVTSKGGRPPTTGETPKTRYRNVS